MSHSTPLLTHENVADFWRRRFRRQKHVNAGVRSLLRKYGSATTSKGVATDLLLTLMGNLIASEACYYRMSGDERNLIPTIAMGATELDSLPSIGTDSVFARAACESSSPRLINSLPRAATDEIPLTTSSGRFRVIASLHHEERLLGVVFLGAKVSGASFTDNDMELIEALNAVTAAVLSHMESQRLAGASETESARLLRHCQELAGGVADHLERSLTAIQQLITTETSNGRGEDFLAGLSGHVGSMDYLVPSLRLLANDPAAIENHACGRYDLIAAVQEAVFSFDPNIAPRSYALSIRHEFRSVNGATPIQRAAVVEATKTTLRSAIEYCSNIKQLDVYIDRAAGLPLGTGVAATSDSSDQHDARAARPMLRIRIAARNDDATTPSSAPGMKILADNLEAFQTLREIAPEQQVIVDQGGAVVWRNEPGQAVWLIYLPLSSV